MVSRSMVSADGNRSGVVRCSAALGLGNFGQNQKCNMNTGREKECGSRSTVGMFAKGRAASVHM